MPERLGAQPKQLWQSDLPSDGLGGLAASKRIVVVSCRDPLDENDLFIALDTRTGKRRWQVQYPAMGSLDYGNAPRATPVIHGDRVILLGAFGQLACVDASSGIEYWRRDLIKDYSVTLPTWGFCGSPLIDGDRVIIQTGVPAASLVALSLETGGEVWRSAGSDASYSSFVIADNPTGSQIVGYDLDSAGGWDAVTGRRLWKLQPEHGGDFNVPTPLVRGNNLWLTTENNGTRRYQFDEAGKFNSKPVSSNFVLASDTHTPVMTGTKIYGVWNGLHCLNADSLETAWSNDAEMYGGYASIIASENRVLILTQYADLVLLDALSDEYVELGKWKLGDGATETHSHPAIAGTQLFVRVGQRIVCFQLD